MLNPLDQALLPHAQALALRNKRAETLAANIAHADTPGYKARDVDFNTVLASLSSRREDGEGQAVGSGGPGLTQVSAAGATTLAITHAAHLTGDASTDPDAAGQPATALGPAYDQALRYRVPAQAALDGNTVDGQVEQAEFARNAVHYQASLTFLQGQIRSVLTAIRGD